MDSWETPDETVNLEPLYQQALMMTKNEDAHHHQSRQLPQILRTMNKEKMLKGKETLTISTKYEYSHHLIHSQFPNHDLKEMAHVEQVLASLPRNT